MPTKQDGKWVPFTRCQTDEIEALEQDGQPTDWIRNVNGLQPNGWWQQRNLRTWEIAYLNTATGMVHSREEYYHHIGIKGMTDEEITTLCFTTAIEANIGAKQIIYDLIGRRPSLVFDKDGNFAGIIKNFHGKPLTFSYTKSVLSKK